MPPLHASRRTLGGATHAASAQYLYHGGMKLPSVRANTRPQRLLQENYAWPKGGLMTSQASMGRGRALEFCSGSPWYRGTRPATRLTLFGPLLCLPRPGQCPLAPAAHPFLDAYPIHATWLLPILSTFLCSAAHILAISQRPLRCLVRSFVTISPRLIYRARPTTTASSILIRAILPPSASPPSTIN